MKVYKVWARVEVMDTETEEHTELDPELCEYKIAECVTPEGVAEFIGGFWPNATGEVYAEISTAIHELIELGRW